MYQYKAKITSVVDGDTFDMDIDLGFNIHIHERVRLLDIDTPEKFGEEKELGLIVKRYAENVFLGEEVVIKSEKADVAADTDSFGRWLVRVTVDGKDICDIYNKLGVNKKHDTYSRDNVLNLEKKMNNFFSYHIPHEIKSKFTKEFLEDFFTELRKLFHFEDPVFYSDDIFYTESTCGWVEAFERTCCKHNLHDVFKYYEKLAWYDSDLFDGELGELFLEYELVEN